VPDDDNITQNTNERLELINREIDATEKLIIDAEEKEFRLNKLQGERSNIQRQETKQLEKIEKQLNGIINAENKRVRNEKSVTDNLESEFRRRKRIRDLEQSQGVDGPLGGANVSGLEDLAKQRVKITADMTKNLSDLQKKQQDDLKKTAEVQKQLNEESIQLAEDTFVQLANIFSQGSEARKIFGLAAIGVDTAQAIASLTAASEANPANAFTFGGAGVIQFASGLVRILANIAAAKELLDGGSFAEGGYTGHGGKHQAAGVVHKGEVVWSQADVAAAGGAGRVNRMRPTYPRSGKYGYADGGVVTNDAVRETNQAVITSNAMKNLPRPEVSVKEITRVMNRIMVKERIATS